MTAQRGDFERPVTPPARPADHQQRATGPDRIREAIARDRGHYAPNQPVHLCGCRETFWDAQTVRDYDAFNARVRAMHTQPSLLRRIGERLAWLVQCPSCLGLRFGLVHLSKRLLIGRH